MTTTLYDIGESLMGLDRMLEESAGEVTPEIEDLLGKTAEALGEKTDGIGKYMRCQEALAEACAVEIGRLTDKKRAAENKVERLERYVMSVMELTGRLRFAGDLFVLRRQQNGGRSKLTVLVPAENLPEQFRTTTTQTRANEDAIRKAFEVAGMDILCAEQPCVLNGVSETITAPIARLEPRGFHLRVE